MKKYLFAALLFAGMSVQAYAQTKYKVVTVVESIIPMGLGRSRMIETKTDLDVRAATTERTSGNDSKQGDVERKDLKADAFAETKLLNFFSAVGINFQNIASNDAVIGAKINEMIKNGWQVANITSGVESDAGKDDGNGIFITRIFFVKH